MTRLTSIGRIVRARRAVPRAAGGGLLALALNLGACEPPSDPAADGPTSQTWTGTQCAVSAVRSVRFQPVGNAVSACAPAPAPPANYSPKSGFAYCGSGVFADTGPTIVTCPSTHPFMCRPPTGGTVDFSLYQQASPCRILDNEAANGCSLTGGCVTCGAGGPTNPDDDAGELAPQQCSISLEIQAGAVTSASVSVTFKQVSGPTVRRWEFSAPSLGASFVSDANGKLVLQASPPLSSSAGSGLADASGATFVLNLDGVSADAPNPRYTGSTLSGEVRLSAGTPPSPIMQPSGAGNDGASPGGGSRGSTGWGSGSGWNLPGTGSASASAATASSVCADSGASCSTDPDVSNWKQQCEKTGEISGCHCQAAAMYHCLEEHGCYRENGAATMVTLQELEDAAREEQSKAEALGRSSCKAP